MILDILVIFAAIVAILVLLDLSVFVGCFIACGFRMPTRTEYLTNAPAILSGLLGGVGLYCLVVIVCLL